MSHTYLLDTYNYIQRRQEEIGRRVADVGHDDWKTRQFAAGQIQALSGLERFLRANFEAKLPRRLQRSLQKRQSPGDRADKDSR